MPRHRSNRSIAIVVIFLLDVVCGHEVEVLIHSVCTASEEKRPVAFHTPVSHVREATCTTKPTRRLHVGTVHLTHFSLHTANSGLTNISAVSPLTSLLGCGALEPSSVASKNGFFDILLSLAASKLLGEAPPGETARLRKGLLEERLTERPLFSRAARVFGESCLRSDVGKRGQ